MNEENFTKLRSCLKRLFPRQHFISYEPFPFTKPPFCP